MKAVHPEVVAATRVNPGDTLRQARESKNWSLPDVALRLNLTVTSLSNLEAGHFEKLPGHTFARGYVRAYAKVLELDQAALVTQFDQYTGTDSAGSSVHALGRIEEPVRLSHNILRIVSLLLLIVLVGGGFFWWQDQTSLRGKDAGLSLEHVEVESADGTTQIHPLDEPEDQAVAEAQTSDSAPLALNPSTPPAQAPAQAPVQTPATPSSTTPPAASPTHSAPATAPAPSAPVAAPAPAAPAVATEAPVAGAGQLSITFIADCWTQVTDAGGKVLYSGLKRKGDTLDVNGKPPLNVRLGAAAGAQVSYNGMSVDVAPFTTGATARLKLGQ
ncbi:Cro/Cl family transcriptional regulator [Pseudomonas sp. S25]|uniref:Cro/Cl family transcriptional regulator n=1 Tax=Pseudomonas maioricensis TaxID=1766623 RepID=A0ABS9ZMK0_9PSED|nr:RodZ family helix-turn-helix domain-containing protein [Pseudomonas sp. S25]MCI8210113.1 Cro/Cl family transcriptional regulator [Pseudomonas sp. S25]